MKKNEKNSVEEKLKNIGLWIEKSGSNNFDDLENNKISQSKIDLIIKQSLNNYQKKQDLE